NWTWELMCFYGELFNGMGYRDYHHMHSPYLWGGTNIQPKGKYVGDGDFEEVMDTQLGIIPVMRRMSEIDSTVALAALPYEPAPPIHSGLSTVVTPASGTTPEVVHDTKWVQTSLNKIGFWPALPET